MSRDHPSDDLTRSSQPLALVLLADQGLLNEAPFTSDWGTLAYHAFGWGRFIRHLFTKLVILPVIRLAEIAPREAVLAQESFVVTVAGVTVHSGSCRKGRAQAGANSGSAGTLSDGHER